MKPEIQEYEELPYLVIDFNSLYEKNQPVASKVHFLRAAFEDFNLYLWREPRMMKFMDRRWDDFINLYEIDYVQELQCDIQQLHSFLEIHRTIVITTDQKIVASIGWRAVANFDYSSVFHNFEYWARRVSAGGNAPKS